MFTIFKRLRVPMQLSILARIVASFVVFSGASIESAVAAVEPCANNRACLRLSGTITATDYSRIASALHAEPPNSRPGSGLYLILDSNGGDVGAAMAIGRLLRSKQKLALVPRDAQCISSCVIVLAGATHRMISGTVAIHRPYSIDLNTNPTMAQKRYAALRGELIKYFSDMNVATSLFYAMAAIPPESVRVLTMSEMNAFGLVDVDPASQDVQDAMDARRLGISREELVRRKASANAMCGTACEGEAGERAAMCYRSIVYGE